jgi:hypothetical protein
MNRAGGPFSRWKEQKMKMYGITVLFFCVAGVLFAQESSGVIRELNGVVEIKAAGSDTWTLARRGDVLKQYTMISTGFRSSALISLGDSLITVRPLTRLSLTELTRLMETDKVLVDLRAGRIRAAVNPPRGGKVEFTVRSPNATASVRGTVFDFDVINLNVHQGQVGFSTPAGPALPVNAGSGSSVNEISQTVRPPVTVTDRALTPTPVAGIPGSGPGLDLGPISGTGSGSNSGSDIGPGPDPGNPSGDSGFTVDLNW